MQIVVDGLLTHYALSGKGKLIVLLHGWGDSIKGWTSLQASLDNHYQVLAIDLPGFGATAAPKTVWNLDNYADFVAKVLAKLEAGQPYAVIGHSNGGALAVRSIGLGILKPQKLVLTAASGIRTGGGLKRAFFLVVAKAGNIATWWMPERYRRALRQRLYGAAGSDMLIVPELQDTFKQTVRQDVQADAAALSLPTLLLYSADDPTVRLADGRRYHELIKNSRLEIVESSGHFVHRDQPEKVLGLIEEFLA